MKLREFMNNNPAIVTVGAVVVLVVALGILFSSMGGGGSGQTIRELYFYDLNTNELFVGDAQQYPPIEAPSGPMDGGHNAGVRAVVFGCGDCSESNRYIAWLETYTMDVKQKLETPRQPGENYDPAMEADMMMMMEDGHLVRSPDGGDWYPYNSPEAQQIFVAAQEKCQDGRPKQCLPE